MNLTKRQLLDVSGELERSLSWKFFKEFLEKRVQENNNLADGYSQDITKLLIREQHTGAAKNLEVLFKDFQSHTANVISTTKEEKENDQ